MLLISCKSEKFNPLQMRGFTLVEALVAMAIFMIGFSGLYLFFGFSQEIISKSEKKLSLNMMAERIVQTIAAEMQNPDIEKKNPLYSQVARDLYASGNLNECPDISKKSNFSNIKEEWSCELDFAIGRSQVGDVREVQLFPDGNGLIVNVSFVIENGKISVYYTRKLRQI